MTYERKIDSAIHLLRSIPQDGPLELSYSGGKDSDVCLRLAQMAGIKFEAIYKNTSIDPKKTFFELIEEKGNPSRWKRFCCDALKKYKVHDRAIQGIRREESTKRRKLYKEPEICRVYSHNEMVRVYLPILEWTLEDVARFIEEQGIQLAPHYYDEGGAVHYERRLGCIGFPLKSDCGKADFIKYPKFLRECIRRYQKFLNTHPNDGTYRQIIRNDAHNGYFYFLFTKSTEEYLGLTQGLLPDANINPKQFLEEYFKISL